MLRLHGATCRAGKKIALAGVQVRKYGHKLLGVRLNLLVSRPLKSWRDPVARVVETETFRTESVKASHGEEHF